MVKYYVKITEEEPPLEDSALWFELQTDDETGKAELFALSKNRFDDLVEEFDDVKNHLKEEYIQPVIDDAIDDYMETFDISSVEKATKLIDSEDDAYYYSYSSLNDALDTKVNVSSVDSSLSTSSTNPVQNKVVATALNSKADSTTVTSLQNTVNGKAPTSHNHNTWTARSITNGIIYYNSQLRIAYFKYYNESYKFTSTSNTKIHSGLVPSDLRPRGGDCHLSFPSGLLHGYIEDASGSMYVKRDSTGTVSINATTMWVY